MQSNYLRSRKAFLFLTHRLAIKRQISTTESSSGQSAFSRDWMVKRHSFVSMIFEYSNKHLCKNKKLSTHDIECPSANALNLQNALIQQTVNIAQSRIRRAMTDFCPLGGSQFTFKSFH